MKTTIESYPYRYGQLTATIKSLRMILDSSSTEWLRQNVEREVARAEEIIAEADAEAKARTLRLDAELKESFAKIDEAIAVRP